MSLPAATAPDMAPDAASADAASHTPSAVPHRTAHAADAAGTPPCLDVVAGIVWRGGLLLANQRPAGGAHGGMWEFPGGKLEAGESPVQALSRELREELGIETRAAVFWREVYHTYSQPARRVRVRFYHVPEFIGEPRGLEGQHVRWVSPAEACELPFLEADRPLVQELRALSGTGHLRVLHT